MRFAFAMALALASAGLPAAVEAEAATFFERWDAISPEVRVNGEAISARAEYRGGRESEVRADYVSPSAARRKQTRRGRLVRHREWYKGGKRWHYVYSRKRSAAAFSNVGTA